MFMAVGKAGEHLVVGVHGLVVLIKCSSEGPKSADKKERRKQC
jgi:hypothetical protein